MATEEHLPGSREETFDPSRREPTPQEMRMTFWRIYWAAIFAAVFFMGLDFFLKLSFTWWYYPVGLLGVVVVWSFIHHYLPNRPAHGPHQPTIEDEVLGHNDQTRDS